VSEKLEAFRAALNALCIEHGVRLSMGYGDDYDHVLRVKEAHGRIQPGLDLDDYEFAYVPAPQPPTPEEIAKREAEAAAYELRCQAERDMRAIERELRLDAIKTRPDYMDLTARIEAHAAETRKNLMRVSTDPADPAYIDARPRKAWCNDVLIEDWTVADEFRRVVITPDKVHHGSVLVERLPAPGAEPAPDAPAMVDAGFSGMFVHVPDAKPAAVPAVPLPALQKPAKRRR
jgi:hypothetical protein